MSGIIEASDAAFVGGVIASIVAMLRGFKAGSADKKKDPVLPESHHTFADIELLAQAISLNTAAVAKLTVILENEAQRHTIEEQAEQKAMLRVIAEQLKPKGRS